MLNTYGESVQEKVDKITGEIAQDFAEELATVTPRSDPTESDGVHLADTVKVTTKSATAYGKKIKTRFVHFGKWQISHLLEFGWTLRNGQKLVRAPFVRPLFDRKKESYVKRYKEELSK